MSAAQAYNSAQDQKDADQAATVAKNRLESIKQDNKYKALQAPDISGIAFEQNARAQADTLEALKGMGPEGAAQATNIEAANRESNLAAAETQGKVNYQRDQLVAQQEQDIEDSRVDRETGLAWGQLQGAQSASADARENKNAAITGAVTSAGNLSTGLGSATSLEAKAQRGNRKSAATGSTTKAGGSYSTNVNDPNAELDFDFEAWNQMQGVLNPPQ